MNTARTWRINSTSSEATLKLAETIGLRLRGGEIIELASDLGGGKTTFVRGLAKGLGSNDKVSSPSFTLCNEYHAGGLTLYHLDFYRLNEPGIMREELSELVHDPKAVVVVEWAEIVDDVLPTERLAVKFKASGATGRELTFEYPKHFEYLVADET